MEKVTFGIQLNADKNLLSRQAPTGRILEIRLQAPSAQKENSRPNLNLALVLDRSGSMRYQKLEYVKRAACHVLDQLNEHDQAGLVVYDDSIQVLARSTPINHGNRYELKQRIMGLHTGNMTNLCDGWLAGCKEVATAAKDGTINRTLLLTDGLANVGQTDPEVLAQHAFELYKDAVSTSTFGVGEGFNEHLLEAMANRGGGNFYFIPNPDDIPEIFMKEFLELVGIAARNIEIKVPLPASIVWQVLGGWSCEYKDGYLHIYVGDMLTGKLQDIYIRLQIPSDENLPGISLNVTVEGKGEGGAILEDQAEIAFHGADPSDVEAEAVNRELMERYSAVELADEAAESLKLERQGQREAADRRMTASLQRNMPFIAAQEAILYQNMSQRMKNGMTEADRKMSHWQTYNKKRKKEKGEDKKKD